MTLSLKRRKEIGRFRNLTAEEHDSCGIIAIIEKDGQAKRQNMLDTIEALISLEHRSGFINGEGDGCGILTDIPRDIWEKRLESAGYEAGIASDPRFAVAHIFVPKHEHTSVSTIQSDLRAYLISEGVQILDEQLDQVNHHALGKNGRKDEPHFWQIACLGKHANAQLEAQLFKWTVTMEKLHPVHVASFSTQTAVYKLMGAASVLPKYYHDLADESFQSLATIGHNRYSTNTLSNFYRVQPFSLLGHNGEINTISKLREEATMVGVELPEGGSDSQDVNRLLETLIHQYQFSLFEALELVFPPIINEIKHLPEHLRDLYMYYRQTWGPFAQGPAGIISRYGNECAFRVDALGLRPLWKVETQRSLYFSSEQGVIPVHEMIAEPKPLAPGESVGVRLVPQAKVLTHDQFQQTVYDRTKKRATFQDFKQFILTDRGFGSIQEVTPASEAYYAAFGWDREQVQMVEDMASNGVDPIRSLGHDAPLAALAKVRQNVADYIKESVAVVTNPAIDREREMEHFSTRVVLGARPSLDGSPAIKLRLELPSPIIVEGKQAQEVCADHSTLSYEELIGRFEVHQQIVTFPLSYTRGTSYQKRLEELANEAIEAVRSGKVLLILDDESFLEEDQLYLDPHLAIAAVDQALKNADVHGGEQNLRRQANLLIRSNALRNLHDIALAIGLGADVISPHLMFRTILGKEGKSASNLFDAIRKGLEKIISTIGIHELRGYARLFSSIGLSEEVANLLGIVNYAGSKDKGLTWQKLETDAEARKADFINEKARSARLFHLWPRIWKPIGQVANGTLSYEEFAEKIEKFEQENPTSLRHLADLRFANDSSIDPTEVDLSVGDHDLPMVISSMSFGSQGEVAFRAYAEAADQLNMVSLNGEGGEIKDMLGKYPRTRGHQIASGRFGVNVELANSANILEIKIGQGAKPGEGGHLPGKKVSEKVAAARNATPGSDLISPSNNHDIYSIEDLAQIITELKTANPRAKIIVKVPIVPNIGTIAVGIAKAGAHIITLSGFDGGTGAARIHALQHVGLPAEVGVKAAHHALLEAGIRDQVEIWADGGQKSALDAVKMMLLGANRIGFATLAMIAIGCTSCKGCHLDTCHVGIATQIETKEQADAHGLRRFVPRQPEPAVEYLKRLFSTFGEEIKRLTAKLGFNRTQDLVGRSDLLEQVRELDRVDLQDLLALSPYPWHNEARQVVEPTSSQELLVAVGAEEIRLDQQFENPTPEILTGINNTHRVMISNISGARVKDRLDGSYRSLPEMQFSLVNGSIPGNGFASFHSDGIRVTVQGGAQDGVGKTAFGGQVSILKSISGNKKQLNGSVGKSFCYGAQKGLFMVQGDADSRAGIRLSGADVIIGGEVKQPINDRLGMIASRANIKGFAFEYMTDGRAVVLGDPGPWICSGMTGGVVYLRYQPEMGLTHEALRNRIAKAAKVSLEPLNEKGHNDLLELLGIYQEELIGGGQYAAAQRVKNLLRNVSQHFVQVVPVKQQADPDISTE
ncbi:glutamate synthase (NADPH/NADH) large chain [Seinonella peptonophila]|uniref:Glutamate synthase (NADPH/NADH) large chain n=1 Tax=Seinonella peptonophila TaxID=112248 RepID=A0A1M4WHA7_9BACL|nr:glutamate synthase-related protein [Seinonella peptonophila]SHE80575.1 glutamate synthase (NADPH/NADH) large chain [Seinonella peptonophila]